MLGAVTTIAGHDVKPILGRFSGKFSGIAVLLGHRDGPLDIVLAKNVVYGVENWFVFSRCGINNNMYSFFLFAHLIG